MARKWVPLSPSKDLDPRLVRLFKQINLYMGDQSGSIAAISRGEAPDGSGTPLPNLDSNKYFLLAGRNSGQLGYGGTGSGENLTLSSTASATKGPIYLGSARTTVFNEVTERLGITSSSPSAKLEIKQPGTTVGYTPASLGGGTSGGWLGDNGDSGSTRYNRVNELTVDDASYVQDQGGGPSLIFQAVLGVVPAQSPSATVVVRSRIRWNGADAGAGGVSLSMELRDGNGTTIHNTGNITIKAVHANGDTGFYAPLDFTLSAGEIATIANWTGMIISVSGSGGGTGYVGTVYISWVQLQIAGASSAVDLIDLYDTNGNLVSGFGSMGALFFKTGAATGLQLTTDPTGFGFWSAPNLLSASHGDSLSGSVLLGDLIHGNVTPKWARLAGNTTTTKKWLSQTGTGSASAVPAWDTLAFADLPGTRIEMEWIANGPYTVDTSVDGGFVAPSAMTIKAVWLYRTTAGASTSTILDLNKNGTTMYTTQANRPTIAFNDGDNKVQATLPDVTSIAAGDIISVDTDQIEGGTPANWRLVVEAA
jgi:hypothetical protein